MRVSGDQAMVAGVAPRGAVGRRTGDKRYLFGPVTDFFCLGGIYLPLLPFIYLALATKFTPACRSMAWSPISSASTYGRFQYG